MMRITLNGESKEVPEQLTIGGLIRHVKLIPELMVAEVNERIYKRDQYESVVIQSGDVVELLRFVGGG